ncbi:hypothetical protein NS220_02040 [Microbacterium testaceum]|uniref:Uncharacterized protein n=1 Tax=Microbacterium testaceum TaxID=2033 RepID=A0A147F155_MICTE|nr:hypothetical protein [Microbacterium testaceum]KTR96477.1 hypothetical protein NS220_02040 [Microbacterium testaceum]
MEPDWSLWVHDAKTGEPIRRLDPEGECPFSASVAGDGESKVTIVVNDAGYPWAPGEIADLFKPNDRLLVRWWGVNGGAHPGDLPFFAHKIDSWDYPLDEGKVTAYAIDLLTESKWRMVDGVGADKYSTLTITNRDAAGAVAQTIARMMQWWGPAGMYPIDLPADNPGTFSGSYPFWKGYSIYEILTEIKQAMGVEIYLRPYATAGGGVRFQTRVAPRVTIGSTLFHLDAARSPVAGITYRVDGSQQVTGLQGIGNGTGEDQETAAAGGVITIPIRDTKKSFDDLSGAALQQAVSAHYAANVEPIVQWDVGGFTIGDEYPPDVVGAASVLQIEVPTNADGSPFDPVIPAGIHTLRVVKVSGGNGRQLKPEVQLA